jgi:hypothetical protein
LPSSAFPDAVHGKRGVRTMMNRRELLAAIGIATFISCRGGERSQPKSSQNSESTVTLVVDGRI